MVGSGGPTLVKERGLKAGMEGLDERTINRVIEEASKGTKYYAKKQADQARTHEQVTWTRNLDLNSKSVHYRKSSTS